MFFLIRSAFWLTVVFTSLPPMVGQRDHGFGDTVFQPGLAIVGMAKDAALSEAKTWCVQKPARCLADAARLTALVDANRTEDLSAEGSDGETLPVPLVDPRRHGPRSAHAIVLTGG